MLCTLLIIGQKYYKLTMAFLIRVLFLIFLSIPPASGITSHCQFVSWTLAAGFSQDMKQLDSHKI